MSKFVGQKTGNSTLKPLDDSNYEDTEFPQITSPQFSQEQNTLPKSTFQAPDSERKVKQFDTNDQALKTKIFDLQKQVDDWRDRYLQMQNDNQALVQELREEIEQYEIIVNDLKQQLQNTSLNDQPNNQFYSQNSEQHQLAEVNENLQNQLIEHDKVLAQYKDQLQNMHIDLNQMHKDNEYAQQLLNQKDREIQELTQQIERNKEIQRNQENTNNKQEGMQKEILRLSQLLKQQQKELQECNNQKQVLQQELIESKQNSEFLTKINLLGQEIERLSNTLALKSREINEYRAQITRMQKEIQNLRMNEFKLQDMNVSLDDLIIQYNKLKEDNQILIKQLSQKQQKQNNEIENKISQIQQDKEQLQQQSNQFKKENDYLREQLQNLSQSQDTNRLLKQQLDKAISQVKQLENDRQQLQQEYQLLSNSYNNQKFNYQQLLQEQQEFNNNQELKKENKRLQSQLQELSEKSYINNNIKDNNEQLSQELYKANNQIQKLQLQINQKEQEQFPDQKLIEKVQNYEIRFPQLVEEIKRLNSILTERNEEIMILNKNSFIKEPNLEKISAYEAEIERLRQTIMLKQQTIESLQQKENQGMQDIVYKLQDENRRLGNLISVRNNEIAELKLHLQDLESKNTKLLADSNNSKYEMQNLLFSQEIDTLNQKLLEANNEINLLKIQKNDKFNEERGKILTQELEKQIHINKENEKELLSLRGRYAESVDAERKLLDCKCLLVLLYNEIERLSQKQYDDLLV